MWRIYEFPVQIHEYMYKNLVDQIQDWIKIEVVPEKRHPIITNVNISHTFNRIKSL